MLLVVFHCWSVLKYPFSNHHNSISSISPDFRDNHFTSMNHVRSCPHENATDEKEAMVGEKICIYIYISLFGLPFAKIPVALCHRIHDHSRWETARSKIEITKAKIRWSKWPYLTLNPFRAGRAGPKEADASLQCTTLLEIRKDISFRPPICKDSRGLVPSHPWPQQVRNC